MQEKPQLDEQSPAGNLGTPSRSGYGVLFIATIAMIMAMASLVFQFYFYDLHKKAKQKMILDNQQIHVVLLNNLTNVKTKLENQQRLINDLIAQNQSEGRKQIVMLADEAEHLITLAQYNINYDANFDLAIQQLMEADHKLQQINDPGINQVRKLLAQDLAALNNTPKVDLNNIIFRISAISDQISSLSNLPVVPPATKQAKETPKKLSWKERLMQTLSSLKGIVSIRRMPEEVKPPITSEQQFYVLEGIRFKLSQAEWAALHQKPDIYQSSLEQAQKGVAKYYGSTQNGTNLIQMISQLQQINVKPEMPNLAETLSTLQNYLNNARQTNTPVFTNPDTNQDPIKRPQPTTNMPSSTTNPTGPAPMPSSNVKEPQMKGMTTLRALPS